MTIGAAFGDFRGRVQALDDVVRQLALAIDDAPNDRDEPAVVDSIRTNTAEVEGDISLLVHASAETRPARAAAECQRLVNRVWRSLSRDLASHHTLTEVERIGVERGGAWRRWSDVVNESLERCEQSVFEAADALAACWGEIVE